MASKTTTSASELTARDVWRKGGDAFELIGRDRILASEANARVTSVTTASASLDPQAGGTYADKPILGAAGVIDHIDSGATLKYPNGIVTFSFLEKNHLVGLFQNPTVGFTADYNVSPFSTAQRAEARQSVQLWDDLVPITFVEKQGTGADIVFSNSWDPAQAYAYYPSTKGYGFQSDVFIADPRINSTNAWLDLGGYGATTLVHEIGHTLGLSHPGSYNYDPNLDLTYANYAEYAQDSVQYSIMSYWDESETGGSTRNWATLQFNNPQTPMVHDILTIQAKYGADLTTRASDTTYGFGSTAARDVYDFTVNKWPFLSIYDAGGKDTINLSGYTASQFVDLHAGAFSSVGQAVPSLAEITQARIDLGHTLGFTLATRDQAYVDNLAAIALPANEAKIAAATGVHGIFTTQFDNLSIAYGTTIENATGGSARDLLWGNAADNVLKGLGGDDVLDGYEGKDVLWGGTGNDTFAFHVVEQGDKIADFTSGADTIDLTGTGVDFSFVGAAAFSHTAGELRYAGGLLEGDVNGDGLADLSIFVAGDPLLVSDLIII